MNECGSTWPEQNAVWEWCDKHFFGATSQQKLELSKATTEYRLKAEAELASAEEANKCCHAARIEAETELTDIRERYDCLNANYKAMMKERDRHKTNAEKAIKALITRTERHDRLRKALEKIKHFIEEDGGSDTTVYGIANKALASKSTDHGHTGGSERESCVPSKSHRFCEDCQYWTRKFRGGGTTYGDCTNENSMIYRHSGGSMVHHSSYCDQWTAKHSAAET